MSEATGSVSAIANEDPVDTMLLLSNAEPSDRVTILGSGHIGLLLGLARRGFATACCRAGGASTASEMPADIVWVPQVKELLLAQVARLLRPGGTAVIGLGRVGTAKRRALRLALATHGLQITGTAFRAGRDFLLATRQSDASLAGSRAAA